MFRVVLRRLAPLTVFEPATSTLTGWHSNQTELQVHDASESHHRRSCTHDRTWLRVATDLLKALLKTHAEEPRQSSVRRSFLSCFDVLAALPLRDSRTAEEQVVVCPTPDLNRDARRQQVLNLSCLPIPPAGHMNKTS